MNKVGEFDQNAGWAWIECYNEVAMGSLHQHVFYLKKN